MRTSRAVAVAAIAVASITSACQGSSQSDRAGPVVITATPPAAPLDKPVTIRLTGLAPNHDVVLTAAASDRSGARWSSHATFRASPTGVVDVSTQRPLAGSSYDVADAMGLFEFMTPIKPRNGPQLLFDATVRLTAQVGDRSVATTTIHRVLPVSRGVRFAQLRPKSSGVYADIALPPPGKRRPAAVAVLGGSEGGLGAAVLISTLNLAAEGYPAMGLAYFHEPGLPHTLSEIPLEYFQHALRVFSHLTGDPQQRAIVWGISRGSEAALLLGAHYPKAVRAVIASSPSSQANRSYPGGLRAAWTVGGQDVPTVRKGEFSLIDPGDPAIQIPRDPAADIPVERISGPVLLMCGAEDEIWPSCAYAHAIVDRRNRYQVTYPTQLVSFPLGGHYAADALPYISQTWFGTAVDGGSPVADRLSQDRAWQDILAFLQRLH